MAGDGMDATLAALLSQTLQPKKRIRGRRIPRLFKAFQQIQAASNRTRRQGRARTERDCSGKSLS
jgi:hypothetical protein